MTNAEIMKLSLTEVRNAIASGKLSSESATAACLEAIKNSKTNSILCTNKEAIEQAKECDKLFKAGKAKGELFGVPIVLKANMCTCDSMPTNCASKFIENYLSPYDATVVTKLKEEGAIIIAKANMDEFAMGASNENSAFGKVLNPLDSTRVPGGSSGGSAAAVAENICFAALGSDTGGSIRQPSAFCGVVGLKPTYGSVSRRGLVAFASSLDQIGPITKTVEDSALLFEVIMGEDPKDSTTNRKKQEFVSACGGTVVGLKIGVAKELFELSCDEDVKRAVNNAIEFYKSNGAKIVDISLPNVSKALAVYYIISSAEAATNLARFDGIRYGKREDGKNLVDIYYQSRTKGFGSEVKRRIMLGNYVLSSGFYDAYYKKATKVQEVLKQEYKKAFEMCDLIISPVAPQVAWHFGAKTTPLANYLADIFTVPVNITGLPAISFPCGKGDDNMPVGLQLIANENRENLLFKAANFFEKNCNRRAK